MWRPKSEVPLLRQDWGCNVTIELGRLFVSVLRTGALQTPPTAVKAPSPASAAQAPQLRRTKGKVNDPRSSLATSSTTASPEMSNTPGSSRSSNLGSAVKSSPPIKSPALKKVKCKGEHPTPKKSLVAQFGASSLNGSRRKIFTIAIHKY